MSISPPSSVYPPYFNQITGSIGPVPVTNPTNAVGSTPPPPSPSQPNQSPIQVTPTSATSAGSHQVDKTV